MGCQALVKHSLQVRNNIPRRALHTNSCVTESVADFCKRPLYTVSAGDLGTSPSSVEKGLGDALELAAKWNAVILIDEADVFLEQRSSHDLGRNGLVSGTVVPLIPK